MVDLMRSLGVEAVPTVGAPFDPNVHDAIMREPSNAHPDGTVLMEFRKGFALGGKLLRPAMVKVGWFRSKVCDRLWVYDRVGRMYDKRQTCLCFAKLNLYVQGKGLGAKWFQAATSLRVVVVGRGCRVLWSGRVRRALGFSPFPGRHLPRTMGNGGKGEGLGTAATGCCQGACIPVSGEREGRSGEGVPRGQLLPDNPRPCARILSRRKGLR